MGRTELAISLGLMVLLPSAVSARAYELRYGLAVGQTWHAAQTSFRETTVAGLTRTDTAAARFRYEVVEAPVENEVRLEARMLSQTMGEEQSPFDFSAIRFLAQTDPRGTMRGVHFQLGEAEPPDLEGVEPDAVAFRQMLRSLAAAWIEAVYWLPELPVEPLSIGESFVIQDRGDVGGTDPGVAMQIESKTRYTLEKVTGRIAEFTIRVSSTVDGATAQSGIVSKRSAEGEALFDLELGMWTRQETRSFHRAALHGTPSADHASGRTVTTIEMSLGDAQATNAPSDRLGL
jgi:hypothetical protein